MAETSNFYGYVDDGNIKLTHGCCSHSCNSDLKKKLENILDGAPESMDSFKEVYEKFGKLNGSFNDALGDANSKFEGMGSSFEQLQQDIENLTRQIDELKNKSCCSSDNDHHGQQCCFPDHSYDHIIHLLKQLKFDMNCEYAKRAQDIYKLEEQVKRLTIHLKHLDLLRVTKLEKIIRDLIIGNKHKPKKLDIKEIDDVLYVNDDPVMVDDFVKSGIYNEDGTITLHITDDKTATVEDVPKPLSLDDVYDILNKE